MTSRTRPPYCRLRSHGVRKTGRVVLIQGMLNSEFFVRVRKKTWSLHKRISEDGIGMKLVQSLLFPRRKQQQVLDQQLQPLRVVISMLSGQSQFVWSSLFLTYHSNEIIFSELRT